MKAGQNCWEAKKCGREPGGEYVAQRGACPVPLDSESDGLNSGKNAGRICWAVSGTFCNEEVQGTFIDKALVCLTCDFYLKVCLEQGPVDFSILKPGQKFNNDAI